MVMYPHCDILKIHWDQEVLSSFPGLSESLKLLTAGPFIYVNTSVFSDEGPPII